MPSPRPRPARAPLALALALLVLLLPAAAAAYPAAAPGERPSVRVQVQPTDKAGLAEILRSDLDVLHARGATLELRVTPTQLDALVARGHRVAVLDPDVYDREGLRGATAFLPEYVTYAEAIAHLNDLATSYPSLTQLTLLGTSVEGRSIYALKISDNAAVDENEPEVLVLGNHHAREVITVILPLALADSLLMTYGTNPQFTQWVDERETWIVPTVNPDGLVYVETTDLWWRKNRRNNGGGSFGVDLNRNYEYEWGHDNNGSSPNTNSEIYRGPAPASEPEVQAIESFIDAHQFVFSISYHSYGNLVLWGPGYKPALSVDQDVFSGFGQTVRSANGYTPGNPASGTIYITNGDTDDWAYHAASHPKVFALTPEVGSPSLDGFHPVASRIPTLVVQGLEASWAALTYADRPERLAPPGQALLDPLPVSTTGTYDLTWSGPSTADTLVVLYELTEKTGPAVVTDDLEAGPGAFQLGGWTTSSARTFSGAVSLYSGSGNELLRICLAKEGYVVQPGDQFTFRAWYDIETNWDYAYVVLSTDGGRSFVNLAGTGTTMSDPNGNNADNGITGSSNGWQLHTYDLSAWVGQTVWLGFRYSTDAAVVNEGIYVDDIWPVQTWTTETVLSSSIAGTTYAIAGRASGTYWYSVRGQDAEGDWGYPSADLPVTVDVTTGVALLGPETLFLDPPAPNPTRGTTSIRFGLPREGDHRLAVYDVGGRLVRVLSAGPAAAGAHRAAWDGCDERGRLVPAGIYFARLSTPSGRRDARVVRVR